MRCNVGINPAILTDQHLIAEYRELLIVPGQLNKYGFNKNMQIPEIFTLGTGHINFFKNKLTYLSKRWHFLYEEMNQRGFVTNLKFPDISNISEFFTNDYNPRFEDATIIKERISEKIHMKTDNFYIFLLTC
jgi:deoxyribonuclease (pyrimidine dimer)